MGARRVFRVGHPEWGGVEVGSAETPAAWEILGRVVLVHMERYGRKGKAGGFEEMNEVY